MPASNIAPPNLSAIGTRNRLRCSHQNFSARSLTSLPYSVFSAPYSSAPKSCPTTQRFSRADLEFIHHRLWKRKLMAPSSDSTVDSESLDEPRQLYDSYVKAKASESGPSRTPAAWGLLTIHGARQKAACRYPVRNCGDGSLSVWRWRRTGSLTPESVAEGERGCISTWLT